MNIRAEGGDDIALTLGNMPQWDFFVQMPHAPVVQVDGDRASSTWTVSEHANNAADGRGYFNYARYDDELARAPDGWRYVSRHYSYYYLDRTPLPQVSAGSGGDAAATPERPAWAPQGTTSRCRVSPSTRWRSRWTLMSGFAGVGRKAGRP